MIGPVQRSLNFRVADDPLGIRKLYPVYRGFLFRNRHVLLGARIAARPRDPPHAEGSDRIGGRHTSQTAAPHAALGLQNVNHGLL
jgi:hypothetical protein